MIHARTLKPWRSAGLKASSTLAPGTIQQRQFRIKNISPYFKGTPVRNITPFQCERWAVHRAAELATQTFVHELETLRAAFAYAQKHGLVLTNPAVGIKRPKVTFSKAIIPTREQFVKLVAQIRRASGQRTSKEGADLVEFLAYSGARIGEARAATWRDVNFQTSMVWIHGTKSERSDRQIPMTDALREFLLKLQAESNAGPADRIVKIDSAKKSLATACKKAGFPKFSHHDFRHFFATTCIESGVDIPTVSRWLGHSDGGALAIVPGESRWAVVAQLKMQRQTGLMLCLFLCQAWNSRPLLFPPTRRSFRSPGGRLDKFSRRNEAKFERRGGFVEAR